MVNLPNPRQPSQMQHNFSQIPKANIPRSQFKRVMAHKSTFDAGYLYPIYNDEVLPGDTFNFSMTTLTRLSSALKTPIMDNLYLDTFFFFVPYRLIWSNFEKFMGAQDNPGDSTVFTIPTVPSGGSGFAEGSIHDYLGLPTKVAVNISVNALFTRVYNLIWNQWFRDENLQNSVTVDTGNGPDTLANYVLLKRGKRADYFTSCLPWPQKGTAVSLPLGTTAPVITNSTDVILKNSLGVSGNWTAKTDTNNMSAWAGDGTYRNVRFGSNSGLTADLTNATAATINDLRLAFQLQHMYERDARGGTRYIELVFSHFGVTNPDFRLQRAELLGTSSNPIVITPIAQQSATGVTGGSTPMGTLGAVGASSGSSSWVKSFTEHGLILGLVSVRADLSYQQGLHKKWTRSVRSDFYFPALAHLGEQAVLNKEIYCDGSGNDALVFGYQERWAEYRYAQSQISGQFRSNNSLTLETWHLAQNFGSLPTLNTTFISETPPISRVEAVTTNQAFLFDSFMRINTVRPMPIYSVPGLIDHF